jgi:hypothetical protein
VTQAVPDLYGVTREALTGNARPIGKRRDSIEQLRNEAVHAEQLCELAVGSSRMHSKLTCTWDPQESDMDPELSALTSTAATTMVQLLATAAWEQAKRGIVGLWRRAHPERADTVQAELEESRTAVLAARQVGDEQVEQALVDEWHGRLRRLVAADPQLADDLRHVVAKLRSALADADPSQDSKITMQATAFGKSRVNQAGRDLHVTTVE